MLKDDCIFCKITDKKIPATLVFENNNVIGFKDLHPLAKIHYLFIHKNHSDDINQMDPSHVAEVFSAINEFTKKEKLDQEGFRVVTNLGPHAGQTVFHTHFHILAGEKLGGFGK